MKKCLLVLGMHRSGTSALMGVLNALQVEIGSEGSEFIGPHSDNTKGFFELVDVVKLNDRILKSLNSSWDSLHVLPENWWKQDGLEEYKKEVARVIETNFKDADMISIKDPRLSRLLPMWAEIFDELKIGVYCIIPLRNPLEVAGSLKSRNGFSLEKSLLLWMIYTLEAEIYSRIYPRVFVTFDGLLRDTPDTIDGISRILNIKFQKSYQDVREDIAQFLDAGLKHHNQDMEPSERILSEEVFGLYRLLSRFVGRDDVTGDELSRVDEIRERHFGLNRLFYNEDMRYADFTVAEKDKTIAEKNQIIAVKEEIIADKERAIARYESRLIYIPFLFRQYRAFRKKFMYPIRDFFKGSEKEQA